MNQVEIAAEKALKVIAGLKMEAEVLNGLLALDGKAHNLPIAVKYDDDLGAIWVRYIGGDKIAMIGDNVPKHALALAVANEGEWVEVGVGN